MKYYKMNKGQPSIFTDLVRMGEDDQLKDEKEKLLCDPKYLSKRIEKVSNINRTKKI